MHTHTTLTSTHLFVKKAVSHVDHNGDDDVNDGDGDAASDSDAHAQRQQRVEEERVEEDAPDALDGAVGHGGDDEQNDGGGADDKQHVGNELEVQLRAETALAAADDERQRQAADDDARQDDERRQVARAVDGVEEEPHGAHDDQHHQEAHLVVDIELVEVALVEVLHLLVSEALAREDFNHRLLRAAAAVATCRAVFGDSDVTINRAFGGRVLIFEFLSVDFDGIARAFP